MQYHCWKISIRPIWFTTANRRMRRSYCKILLSIITCFRIIKYRMSNSSVGPLLSKYKYLRKFKTKWTKLMEDLKKWKHQQKGKSLKKTQVKTKQIMKISWENYKTSNNRKSSSSNMIWYNWIKESSSKGHNLNYKKIV